MKKNTAYTIGSLVILLICAFCFVILPALTGSGQAQAKLPSFGKYAGKEISMNEGSDMRDFAANYSQMFQNAGQQLDEQTYFYILNSAFNSTASKYAYQKAVKDSGYVVSDAAIRQKMVPYFFDENGKYSSKLYKQVPDSTKQELRDSVEDNLYTTRFYDDNFGSDSDIVGLNSLYGIKESDAELDFLQEYGSTKRGFNMAYFPLSDYPKDEVVKYGKSNSDKFLKFDLSVITTESESLAKTVANRLSNNEITFEDAVNEYSQKAYGDSTGKITSSYEYQLSDILVNKDDLATLKSLTAGNVSSIIQTAYGYSIFKANGSYTAPDFDSDETVEVVKNYLTKYESSIIEDYFTVKANNLVNEAKASNFKTACGNHEVANVEIAPFPLNFGNVSIAGTIDKSSEVLANADTNENFLKTAFSLNKDEISKPFVMNKNVVVLQYTTEEKAENASVFNAGDLKNFDEVAAQTFILNSDKLENNFTEVYFNNFMNN